jgi:hypothetical protein
MHFHIALGPTHCCNVTFGEAHVKKRGFMIKSSEVASGTTLLHRFTFSHLVVPGMFKTSPYDRGLLHMNVLVS